MPNSLNSTDRGSTTKTISAPVAPTTACFMHHKRLHAFFRAYYFYKSADYKGNNPHPLKARTAEEMAQIPTYYLMENDKGMAATVAPFMPPADYIANCNGWRKPRSVCTRPNTAGLVSRRATGLSRAAGIRS
jgi:hypothetical protein